MTNISEKEFIDVPEAEFHIKKIIQTPRYKIPFKILFDHFEKASSITTKQMHDLIRGKVLKSNLRQEAYQILESLYGVKLLDKEKKQNQPKNSPIRYFKINSDMWGVIRGEVNLDEKEEKKNEDKRNESII